MQAALDHGETNDVNSLSKFTQGQALQILNVEIVHFGWISSGINPSIWAILIASQRFSLVAETLRRPVSANVQPGCWRCENGCYFAYTPGWPSRLGAGILHGREAGKTLNISQASCISTEICPAPCHSQPRPHNKQTILHRTDTEKLDPEPSQSMVQEAPQL
jgi:hypothetical protein